MSWGMHCQLTVFSQYISISIFQYPYPYSYQSKHLLWLSFLCCLLMFPLAFFDSSSLIVITLCCEHRNMPTGRHSINVLPKSSTTIGQGQSRASEWKYWARPCTSKGEGEISSLIVVKKQNWMTKVFIGKCFYHVRAMIIWFVQNQNPVC